MSETGSPAKPSRSEVLPFKPVFEALEAMVPRCTGVVITTLPRASLQIAQPARLPDGYLRAYSREFHLLDRLSWQAIWQQRPVRLKDSFQPGDRFLTDFLAPSGVVFAAAAPLASPILEGYPGALHVYRAAGQGAFSDVELKRLREASAEIDQITARMRLARRGSDVRADVALTPRPRTRLFIFNPSGQQILPGADFDTFDEQLRDDMSKFARTRLSRIKSGPPISERVLLPDSWQDLWAFRAVIYPSYPAVANGPVVIFALQPTWDEWLLVRQNDFQADPELGRLIPAMKFMKAEFQRGPTLNEIAAQVRLSPFHFHRRFTELLGLTPKHFLLDCQITQAKAEILARRRELSQIAADCGFAHQSHFTSRFKQATGLTPTRWRRTANDARPD